MEREIHRLLHEADCVIVPGFGGFLAHRRGAVLDRERRLIHPPAKEVSFNRRLTRNDGLLADRLAAHEGIAHRQALGVIDRTVAEWRERIARDGRLELASIGVLFRGPEGDLQFAPEPGARYLKDAFGLPALAAVPVERAVVRAILPATPPRETDRAPLLWTAAAVAAVLFASGTWLAYRSGMMDGTQMGSFSWSTGPAAYAPRTVRPAPIPDPPEAPWSIPPEAHGVRSLPLAGNDAPTVSVDLGPAPRPPNSTDHDATAAPAEPDKTAVATRSTSTGRYHVVGGCFSIKQNADNFIAHLRDKGFEAGLIDHHHGLYRVAFGSYPDRAMALEALAVVRKDGGADAWLLVK